MLIECYVSRNVFVRTILLDGGNLKLEIHNIIANTMKIKIHKLDSFFSFYEKRLKTKSNYLTSKFFLIATQDPISKEIFILTMVGLIKVKNDLEIEIFEFENFEEIEQKFTKRLHMKPKLVSMIKNKVAYNFNSQEIMMVSLKVF